MNKFVLLVLGLSTIGVASSGSPDVEQYCQGQSIALHTVGDVKPLIDSLKAGPVAGCSEEARQAVLDLEPIIEADNVCSIEVAKLVGRYYELYVRETGIFRRRPSNPIEQYFLGVGLKISKLCQESLMHNLKAVSDERIPIGDEIWTYGHMRVKFDEFNKRFINLAERVGGENLLIQNLFIIKDVADIFLEKSKMPALFQPQIIQANSETKQYIDGIKTLCRNKFKPVYEKLFSPLVILTNLGFEYTSNSVHEYKLDFREERIYKKWYTAVLMCESTLGLNVVDETNSGETTGQTGTLDSGEVSAVEEYNLSIQLNDWMDLTFDEILKEIETISKKRKEAESSRKKVLKRL